MQSKPVDLTFFSMAAGFPVRFPFPIFLSIQFAFTLGSFVLCNANGCDVPLPTLRADSAPPELSPITTYLPAWKWFDWVATPCQTVRPSVSPYCEVLRLWLCTFTLYTTGFSDFCCRWVLTSLCGTGFSTVRGFLHFKTPFFILVEALFSAFPLMICQAYFLPADVGLRFPSTPPPSPSAGSGSLCLPTPAPCLQTAPGGISLHLDIARGLSGMYSQRLLGAQSFCRSTFHILAEVPAASASPPDNGFSLSYLLPQY